MVRVIWINQLVSGLKLHKHGMTKISTTEMSCMSVNFKIQEDNTSNKPLCRKIEQHLEVEEAYC